MTRRNNVVAQEEELLPQPVTGLQANYVMLSIVNEAVGKEVLVEARDGSVHNGIFAGVSHEMEVGLYCSYESTPENAENLLPRLRDLVEKRRLQWNNVLCVTVPLADEKHIRGFITDRDYNSDLKKKGEECEFEEWRGDGEETGEDSAELEVGSSAARTGYSARNGGWGVNEMFDANHKLGVQSTFDEDLSQYTTAEVEGTKEDRERAEKIAREIETNCQSKQFAALENDDEERDLDKLHFNHDERNTSKRGGSSNNSRGGSRPLPAQPINRRAEGLRDNNKGRGGVTNSGGGRFQSQQTNHKATGQHVRAGMHDDASKRPRDGRISGVAACSSPVSSSSPRVLSSPVSPPPRDVVLPSLVVSSATFTSTPPSRPTNPSPRPFPPASGTSPNPRPQANSAHAGRVENLRNWNTEFSSNYRESRPSRQDSNQNEESGREQIRVAPSAAPSPATPQGPPNNNAWRRGPPNLTHTNSSAAKEAPTAEAGKGEEKADTAKAAISQESKDSKDTSKKFSFNPDAPAFTPKTVAECPLALPPAPPPQAVFTSLPVSVPVYATPSTLPLQAVPGHMSAMPSMQTTMVYASPAHFGQQATPFIIQPTSYMMGSGGLVAGSSGRPPQTGTAAAQMIPLATPRRPIPTTMSASPMYVHPGIANYQQATQTTPMPHLQQNAAAAAMQYYSQQYGGVVGGAGGTGSAQPTAYAMHVAPNSSAMVHPLSGRPFAVPSNMTSRFGMAEMPPSQQPLQTHAYPPPPSSAQSQSQHGAASSNGSNGHGPSQPPTPGPGGVGGGHGMGGQMMAPSQPGHGMGGQMMAPSQPSLPHVSYYGGAGIPAAAMYMSATPYDQSEMHPHQYVAHSTAAYQQPMYFTSPPPHIRPVGGSATIMHQPPNSASLHHANAGTGDQ